MAQDVSAFGAEVALVASNTFPAGFVISQWSNDADPFDFPSVKIGDVAMGVNGDLISWNRAVPLVATVNVIPGSDDDQNLSILAEANRVGQGKNGANDVIAITVIYPDGSTYTFTQGKITDATFGKSASGEGRLKTRPYVFAFQNTTVTPATA